MHPGADQARFERLRKVELKHGRIAMLAVLGHIITTKGDRFPGEIAYGVPFSSVKNGLAAFETIPAAGLGQIIAFIGLMEWGFSSIEKDLEVASCESYIGKNIFLRGGLEKKKAIELNNGRAAQMGILGLMVHEKLNNDPYGKDFSAYLKSPSLLSLTFNILVSSLYLSHQCFDGISCAFQPVNY